MKPTLRPPTPSALVVEARTALELSHDPVEVVEAALALRDLRPILPVGGGMAMPGRAAPYARDVVDALTMRGMLTRQGRLL